MTLTPLGDGNGSTDLVPFGKYKGMPVEVLIADRSYCDWLGAQPWFRERHGNVYNIIFPAGGSQPQDTPDHNAMQARFLDHREALRIVDPFTVAITHFSPIHKECTPEQRANLALPPTIQSTITDLSFETQFGWDVVVSANVEARIHERSTDYPDAWTEDVCSEGGGEACLDACRGYYPRHHTYDHEPTPYRRVIAPYTTSLSVAVELKPTVGEDYPSILRDVVRRANRELAASGGYARHTRYVVLADRVTFESVTLAQVKQMFASQAVEFVTAAELPPLMPCACEACTPETPDPIVAELAGG